MRRSFIGQGVAVLGVVVATAACGSSGNKTASSTANNQNTASSQANKAAFCSANVTMDKAGETVNSADGFLAVIKANSSAIATIEKDAPTGKVGTEARALVKAANSAVASNNANVLLQVPRSYGADVDTYCGVDGNGDPLPSYFATGKGTAFCGAELQISAGTSDAQGPGDILSFLKAHTALLSQAAANVSSLPASVKNEVQTLVGTAQQAVSGNNANLLGSPAIQKDATDADLYCGQNH